MDFVRLWFCHLLFEVWRVETWNKITSDHVNVKKIYKHLQFWKGMKWQESVPLLHQDWWTLLTPSWNFRFRWLSAQMARWGTVPSCWSQSFGVPRRLQCADTAPWKYDVRRNWMKSRVKMGAHSTNEVLFCLCLHRECFTMFYMFVSLSLSLQICRLFLFSAARPCWRVLCVVACCGFKIVLQNAGSFLETKHDRAMKVWSWFWGKVGQTMRNYCIYRRLPSYLLRPFVAGSISVQAKCCLAELEFSDAGTQHTWMMPQADQHREADVSRNDMISNAPKWLEWFAGVPTCSGYKVV